MHSRPKATAQRQMSAPRRGTTPGTPRGHEAKGDAWRNKKRSRTPTPAGEHQGSPLPPPQRQHTRSTERRMMPPPPPATNPGRDIPRNKPVPPPPARVASRRERGNRSVAAGPRLSRQVYESGQIWRRMQPAPADHRGQHIIIITAFGDDPAIRRSSRDGAPLSFSQ